MSSILDSLSTAVFGEEGDDPSCLTDPVTASLYEAPAKGLGISANFTPWEARDALRNNCLALLGPTHFNRKDKPVLTHKYALLAYHLCMKTLKIKKAQQLKALMEDEPRFFQGGASDMLQILRPVPCEGVAMHPHVRAGAMLHVIYDDYALCQEAGEPMPHQQYVIQISYCGRQHFIRRRYSEFRALHDRLSKELLVVPGFPNGDASYKIGLGDYAARGRALCRYAGRVHASLAARGVFSPRLLAFLEVDAARVHIEEDGRVSKLLDSTAQISGSAWHMVDEYWLKRWRKFVLGRAARRYEPPGPITNERLLIPLAETAALVKRDGDEFRATTVPRPSRRKHRETFAPASATVAKYHVDAEAIIVSPDEASQKAQPEPATIGRHYRAINYDLWVYWKMVHGGGPCISRKTKELDSLPACGAGREATSRLQRFGRVCIAKQRKLEDYWRHLSATAAGVREVLADAAEQKIRDRVDETLGRAKNKRTEGRLKLAARYTQRMWRSKKAYAFNDDNVRVMKHAQEIFATADGEVEHASAGAPFIVEEGERIVQLGGAEQYEVKFTEADGPSLPVVLKKHSCSELTFVHSVDKKALSMKKGRDQLLPDSVLLVVQAYPASSLSHEQVMHRLRSAKWPLTLRFARPLAPADVAPVSRILELDETTTGGLPADLKLQMVKRVLAMGVPIRKHAKRGSPHDTVLYLNETMLFWRIKNATKLQADSKIVRKKKVIGEEEQPEVRGLSLKYDLTKGVGLYEVRYVRVGKISAALRRGASRKAPEAHCFSLFCDGNKTLDFEILKDASVDSANARTLFAWAFDKIVAEARGTKIFVDKTGAPVARSSPKKRLRMIVGAR
mmetsp:Transcript_36274/g.112244  ORF Transcript_36274/g.112244 Transcript_36274/m.112244 type:complete len:848 (+) Transcript_36274:242-2785(+)